MPNPSSGLLKGSGLPAGASGVSDAPALLWRATGLAAGAGATGAWLHGFTGTQPRPPDEQLRKTLGQVSVGIKGERLENPLLLAQPHGNRVLALNGTGENLVPSFTPRGQSTLSYDGIWGAGHHRETLVIKSADCVPILAVEHQLGLHAALHAGWRGVAAGILPELLRQWQAAGSNLAGVRLAFGPHIGSCCFEVREDCLSHFEKPWLKGAVKAGAEGTYLLDLAQILLRQALAFGLLPDQIEQAPMCTFCNLNEAGAHPFASYRRGHSQDKAWRATNIAFIAPA